MKSFLRNALRVSGLGLLLLLTWAIDIYHVGVYPPPRVDENMAPAQVQWIPRDRAGINQLILTGAPYARGLAAGQTTRQLLRLQEESLVSQLGAIFPNTWIFRAFSVVLIRWFWGIEKYFEPWMIEEMYGVSKSAPSEFNYLSDPFTRQVAYHGLHEVGQMMVDQGRDGMGCTVVAVPSSGGWIIGRNFDFEAGEIFDTEKIMKWVFPDQGYAFVSVIWAGMVGAVTGVNEHGLYISINAAGSTDFRRYGTPSTLVLLKALQNARTADEAAAIIRNEQMFITDIFVVSDPSSGKLLRIEKSPLRTEVISLTRASIVTNHLIGPTWQGDSINEFRRRELTSELRQVRGEARLASLMKETSAANQDQEQARLERGVLSILRDKGESNHHARPLGNRAAIDALIAIQSVVYNEASHRLWVGQGPGVSGPFIGYDLRASFATRQPVRIGDLPRDPEVSDQRFAEIRQLGHLLSQAQREVEHGQCAKTRTALARAQELRADSSAYFAVLGDYQSKCAANLGAARAAWLRSLELGPAYPREIRELHRRLEK